MPTHSAPPPASEGTRARGGWFVLATLVACLAAALLGRRMPAVLPADAAPELFSAGRAREIVAEIARAPHPVGSEEHARVRGILLARLGELGLAPEVQTGRVRTSELANLIARVPGSASSGTLLCLAHYDSRPTTPGAGDDSIGVAAWLEAFRALRARGWRPRNDVVLVLTDGEELGLLGAYLFAAEHELARGVACVVNLEAIGNGGPAVLFELGRDNGARVRAFAAAVGAPTGTSLGDAVYRRMPNDTDYSVFRDRGIGGFNLAITSGSQAYHAPHDTPERLDPRSLQHMGESALALALHLGDTDLGDTDFGGGGLGALDAPDVTFFDVLGYGLVRYGRAWDVAFALLAAALALLACARVHAKGRDVLALVLRHLLEVAAVAGAIALAWWLADGALALATSDPGWVAGNTTSGALLFAGAVLLASGAELALAGTRGGAHPARAGGVALLWSALALASLRWLPGAGFVFAWPAILASLGALATLGRPSARWREAALALGLATALLLGLPILHLLVQLFSRAPLEATLLAGGVLSSGAALFALPLARVRRDVPRAAPALLAAGAALLVASVVVARALAWRQGALLP